VAGRPRRTTSIGMMRAATVGSARRPAPVVAVATMTNGRNRTTATDVEAATPRKPGGDASPSQRGQRRFGGHIVPLDPPPGDFDSCRVGFLATPAGETRSILAGIRPDIERAVIGQSASHIFKIGSLRAVCRTRPALLTSRAISKPRFAPTPHSARIHPFQPLCGPPALFRVPL